MSRLGKRQLFGAFLAAAVCSTVLSFLLPACPPEVLCMQAGFQQ